MLIDIICLFVDSSKNPRIDSSARLKDLVGNLVIKAFENWIALLFLRPYLYWQFKSLYGFGYLKTLISKISELMNAVNVIC